MSNLRHKDTLIRAFVYKISESLIRHGEDMWLGLLPAPAAVHVDVFSRVNG